MAYLSPAMTLATFHLIEKRRADIRAVIADLTSQIDKLRLELNELEVAERVLSRLGAQDRSDEPSIASEARSIIETSLGKPDDIPTMPEMILEALSTPEADAHDGLEPRDIVQFVAKKYWPDVRSELVGPIAWRMWKRGQLEKTDTYYRLPQTNEAADGVAGEHSSTASDVNPAKGREAGPGGGT